MAAMRQGPEDAPVRPGDAQEEKAARMKGKQIDVEESLTKAESIKAEGNALFKSRQHMAAAKKYRDGIRCFEKKKGVCVVEVRHPSHSVCSASSHWGAPQ